MPTATKKSVHISELDVGRVGRPQLEPQIKLFHKTLRKRLRRLARAHSRFGDLIFSFPAAAVAIAVGGPSAEQRAEAAKAVKDGVSLQKVAAALNLPAWFRRLPPTALRATLQPPLDGPKLARAVGGNIPEGPEAALWLEAVCAASHMGGDDFAAWVAVHKGWEHSGAKMRDAVGAIAAYAWYSVDEQAAGKDLMDRRWSKRLTFLAASSEARCWLERVVHRHCRQELRNSQSWRKAQRHGGYLFAPLTTGQELQAEGVRMNNCIATYQRFMERGGCLLFAVRRGSESVASIELRADPHVAGKARIVQLEGPNNGPAPQRVVKAVEGWLKRQGDFPLGPEGGLCSHPVDPKRWAAFWAPYVAQIGEEAAGPFAMRPTGQVMRALAAPLNALEYI